MLAPTGLLLAEGSLWVANQSALSVTRIDPQSGHSARHHSGRRRTAARSPPPMERFGRATNTTARSAESIRRRTRSSTPMPRRIAARPGGRREGPLAELRGIHERSPPWRNAHVRCVRCRRFPADWSTRPPPTTQISASSAAAVYDGLVAYRATGGAAGVALVPDLAATLPRPTNGGRTYTFTIRSGVRFSNGLTCPRERSAAWNCSRADRWSERR